MHCSIITDALIRMAMVAFRLKRAIEFSVTDASHCGPTVRTERSGEPLPVANMHNVDRGCGICESCADTVLNCCLIFDLRHAYLFPRPFLSRHLPSKFAYRD